jgi:serine/threonine protein kinase/WD40 repeat protein
MDTDKLGVESIFLEAVEKPTAEARSDYLDSACGADAELRQRIERLLAAHPKVSGFLESPAPGLIPPTVKSITELPGTVIGPYKLLEQIGEGGFGVVFMAEQQQPVRRKVALKVLKPGMDTRQVIARFEAERQALALMDHPNIAKVLDAGTTRNPKSEAPNPKQIQSTKSQISKRGEPGESKIRTSDLGFVSDFEFRASDLPQGRPYFVMELVKGLPIIDYCDQNNLQIRQRLELFMHVCRAVQHAHQKGIIHRDLKPTNIMVTLHDGRPVPKIIDFGIAKALGQQLTDKTLYTGFAQMIGTPLYMSPEQAELSGLDVDTRSDIYSLGVLLYELLTGTTPFDQERLRTVGYDEIRRIIREEEPPRPSTRMTTLGQAASTASSNRQTDPQRLSQLLRGELDWIVMKCLEKDRDRRYETANGLARDIERYLHDEPVQACPPSTWYRFRKLARRHRGALAVGSLVTAVLILAMGILAIGRWRIGEVLQSEKEANLKAKTRLWESLRDRAQALRTSRRPGQKVKSIRSIQEALQLPLPPGHSLEELRTEAIAAIAIPDLEVLQDWEGYMPNTVAIEFDGNLERYARLGLDGTICVCRISDKGEIASWQEPTEGPWPVQESDLRFSPDGRYLCVRHASSGRITVRRLDGPKPIICYEGTKAAAGTKAASDLAMDFSPDSKKLAYLLTDTRIALVDLHSGQPRFLPPTRVQQNHIRFAPDGNRFALRADRTGKWAVEVRDAATGQVQQTLDHPRLTSHLDWHPDGRVLATCCDDLFIRLWDVPSGQVVHLLDGHRTLGIRCAFSCKGDLLLSNDWDDVLRVWEGSSGKQMLSFPAAGFSILRVSPDNRVATIQVSDPTRAQLLRVHPGLGYHTVDFQKPTSRVAIDYRTLQIHPGGRLLAARAPDHSEIVLADLRAGCEVARLRIPPGAVVGWGSSGDLFTSGAFGLLRWPLHPDPAGKGHYRLGPPERLFSAKVWGLGGCSNADGQTFVIPMGDDGAMVLHGGRQNRTVHLHPQPEVRGCALSPDCHYVATASHEKTDGFGVKVWEAETGRLVKKLPVPGNKSGVGFSPDGRWLLTSSGGCRLWEVASWNEVRKIGGATGCFSPDGSILAVEDTAGVIRLVSPNSGAELAQLEAPVQTRLTPRCFTPDGTRLIAVKADTQTLHIWDLPALRQGLAAIGLSGDALPDLVGEPPADNPAPLTVTVDMGDFVRK